MPEALRTRARFPDVEAKAGHYESFYLKASDPAAPRGIWIRYTVHKRPGEAPRGSLWFTLFGPEGPRAVKVTTLRALRARRPVHPDRRERVRARRGHGERGGGLARRVVGPRVRHGRRGSLPPAARVDVQRPGAAHEAAEPVSERPLLGPRERRRGAGRHRGLAGDGRPQLGRRARRALDLDARHELRPPGRGLARCGHRQDQARPLDDPVDRQRRRLPRRHPPPPRRDRARALDRDRRDPDRLRVHAARESG